MADFHTTDQEALALIEQLGDLNNTLNKSKQTWMAYQASVSKVADSFKSLHTTHEKILADWQKNHTIGAKNLIMFGLHAGAVRKLKVEMESMERVQKMLNLATRPWWESLKSITGAATSAATGVKNLAVAYTGLDLTKRGLLDRVLKFNRTLFETMKIADRYGESLGDVQQALMRIKTGTTISQQGFLDMNKAFKEMYLGIPPTTQAIAQFAQSLVGRLGYAEDEIIAKSQELLSLQNKFPDLLDRITRAQESYSVSLQEGDTQASDLMYTLRAFGLTGQEITKVLNAIQPPKATTAGLMTLEQTIAKANQTTKDANLEIGQKLAPTLASIETLMAKGADAVSQLNKGLLVTVGILGTMAAPLNAAVAGLANMMALSGGVRGAGKAAFSPRGAMVMGGVAMGGLMLYNKFGGARTPAAGAPPTNPADYGKMDVAKGVAGSAAAGAGMGLMTGNPLFALIGAIIGAGKGVLDEMVGGNKRLEAWNAKLAEESGGVATSASAKAEQIGAVARGSGVKGLDEAVQVAVGDETNPMKVARKAQGAIWKTIKEITNEKKKDLAIERLIGAGLVSRKDVEFLIGNTIKSEQEKRIKIEQLIKNASREERGRLNLAQMINDKMDAQLVNIKQQMELIDQISSGAPKMIKSLTEAGMPGKGLQFVFDVDIAASKDKMGQTIDKMMQNVARYAATSSSGKDIKNMFPGATPEAIASIANYEQQIKAKNEEINKLSLDMPAQNDPEYSKAAARMGDLKSEVAKLETQIDAANKKMLEGSNVSRNYSSVFDILKKLRTEYATIQAKATSSQSGGIAGQSKDFERLVVIRKALADVLQDFGAIYFESSRQMDASMSKATMITDSYAKANELSVDLTRQKMELARETNLGMAQDYFYTKETVMLLQQGVNLQKQRMRDVEKAAQEQIDQGPVNFKINWGEAEADAAAYQIKVMKEAYDQIFNLTKNHNTAEAISVQLAHKVNQALTVRASAQSKMLSLTKEELALTKQYREGYLDSMTEMVSNAGDFAAIIGSSTKGVPQLLAAGAPATMRYGGQADLSAGQIARVKSKRPAAYATRFGEMTSVPGYDMDLTRYTGAGRSLTIEEQAAFNQQYVNAWSREGHGRMGTAQIASRTVGGQAWSDATTEAAVQGQGVSGRGWYSHMRVPSPIRRSNIDIGTAMQRTIPAGVRMTNGPGPQMNLPIEKFETSTDKFADAVNKFAGSGHAYATGGVIPGGSYVVNAGASRDAMSKAVMLALGGKVVPGTGAGDSVRMLTAGGPAAMTPGEIVMPPGAAGVGRIFNSFAEGGEVGSSIAPRVEEGSDTGIFKDGKKWSPVDAKNEERKKAGSVEYADQSGVFVSPGFKKKYTSVNREKFGGARSDDRDDRGVFVSPELNKKWSPVNDVQQYFQRYDAQGKEISSAEEDRKKAVSGVFVGGKKWVGNKRKDLHGIDSDLGVFSIPNRMHHGLPSLPDGNPQSPYGTIWDGQQLIRNVSEVSVTYPSVIKARAEAKKKRDAAAAAAAAKAQAQVDLSPLDATTQREQSPEEAKHQARIDKFKAGEEKLKKEYLQNIENAPKTTWGVLRKTFSTKEAWAEIGAKVGTYGKFGRLFSAASENLGISEPGTTAMAKAILDKETPTYERGLYRGAGLATDAALILTGAGGAKSKFAGTKLGKHIATKKLAKDHAVRMAQSDVAKKKAEKVVLERIGTKMAPSAMTRGHAEGMMASKAWKEGIDLQIKQSLTKAALKNPNLRQQMATQLAEKITAAKGAGAFSGTAAPGAGTAGWMTKALTQIKGGVGLTGRTLGWGSALGLTYVAADAVGAFMGKKSGLPRQRLFGTEAAEIRCGTAAPGLVKPNTQAEEERSDRLTRFLKKYHQNELENTDVAKLFLPKYARYVGTGKAEGISPSQIAQVEYLMKSMDDGEFSGKRMIGTEKERDARRDQLTKFLKKNKNKLPNDDVAKIMLPKYIEALKRGETYWRVNNKRVEIRPSEFRQVEAMIASKGFANGGALDRGSYVIKASAADRNKSLLESLGAEFVSGGVPGRDSVPRPIHGGGMAMLTPKEAILSGSAAALGPTINRRDGGPLELPSALTSAPAGGRKTDQTITAKATGELARLLTFQTHVGGGNISV